MAKTISPDEVERNKIDLGEHWRLSTDRYNYILQRKRVRQLKSKDCGQTYYTIEGYYQSIDHVLEAIVDLEIKDCDVKTLLSLQRKLGNIHKDIKNYAKQIADFRG